MLKQLFIFVLFGICTLSAKAQNYKRATILPQSKISLAGHSNINSFTCLVSNNEEVNKLQLYYRQGDSKLIFEHNKYIVPIERFVCENSRMTRDLRVALKMAEHPDMRLELLALSQPIDTGDIKEADLKITLAGRSNTYRLEYVYDRLSQNLYKVKSKHKLNMIDFGIAPPTAMLGLIKVKESISIEIDLYILVDLK